MFLWVPSLCASALMPIIHLERNKKQGIACLATEFTIPDCHLRFTSRIQVLQPVQMWGGWDSGIGCLGTAALNVSSSADNGLVV